MDQNHHPHTPGGNETGYRGRHVAAELSSIQPYEMQAVAPASGRENDLKPIDGNNMLRDFQATFMLGNGDPVAQLDLQDALAESYLAHTPPAELQAAMDYVSSKIAELRVPK